jgi:hypothetical protein
VKAYAPTNIDFNQFARGGFSAPRSEKKQAQDYPAKKIVYN